MLAFIRGRLSFVNVAVVVVLVFVMSGGAYAASKFLITSTKQISPKVLKQLRGRTGPQGKTGAVGPAGPAGVAGAVGPAGPQGQAGAQGKEGVAGKEGKEGPVGKEGKEGPQGLEGKSGISPLQPGETERGVWSMTISGTFFFAEELGFVGFAPITFSRPLPFGHEPKVHFVGNGTSTECPSGGNEPAAEEGNLCIYGATFPETGGPTFFSSENHEIGDVLIFTASKAEGFGEGTWAMTAE